MRRKLLLFCVGAAVIAGVIGFAAGQGDMSVLNTAGTIGDQQRDLLVWVTVLMLLIVVPVFLLTGHIVWKYRADNHRATYSPEWDGNRRLEAIWWGFPTAIILVLSVVIWQTSHSLDPFRPIAASAASSQPITIQVVALQWKWLFIYPQQNMATVNYVAFPEDTPVNFEITADAPMNSFWIPRLGGQVYAMSGMRTNLHLAANEPGVFRGSSANLSGAGFAGMNFKAVSMTQSDFERWTRQVGSEPQELSRTAYDELRQPGKSDEQYYGSTTAGLQATIISKYGSHGGQRKEGHNDNGPHEKRQTSRPTEIEGFRY